MASTARSTACARPSSPTAAPASGRSSAAPARCDDGVCAPGLALGETCASTSHECASGLYCQWTDYTCTDQNPVEGSCDSYTLNSGQCAVPSSVGATCDRFTKCADGLNCSSSVTGGTGQCVVPVDACTARLNDRSRDGWLARDRGLAADLAHGDVADLAARATRLDGHEGAFDLDHGERSGLGHDHHEIAHLDVVVVQVPAPGTFRCAVGCCHVRASTAPARGTQRRKPARADGARSWEVVPITPRECTRFFAFAQPPAAVALEKPGIDHQQEALARIRRPDGTARRHRVGDLSLRARAARAGRRDLRARARRRDLPRGDAVLRGGRQRAHGRPHHPAGHRRDRPDPVPRRDRDRQHRSPSPRAASKRSQRRRSSSPIWCCSTSACRS